ncbi:hypothetical protein JK359_23625 [Streptomyces actinomycinicus]|uniref:Uncharacterized protein n=1 Tax=Streptomyces actinomycinicus TaxID=1695166 RepID=A0A937JMP2_9ACTN|nr:hypothetical protein [Streptomyces actinomycinicus]MBL1084924.1 hypothetical protein [Streptomyces actinomycinicus]
MLSTARGVLSRIPAKLRLPLAGTVALALLAAGLTLFLPDPDGGRLAANRAQLKRACGGLLPYSELVGHVPDDAEGTLDQYGTLLQPGQESRSLLHCSLEWEGHGGVHVEAATLVNHLPYELKTDDLLAPGHEAPGVTGRYGDDSKRLWIVAECPRGLTGRARPSAQMYVTAYLDKASVRTEFRLAVAVADAIAQREHCGTTPAPPGSAPKVPARVIDTYQEHDADGGPVEEGDHDSVRVDRPGRGIAKCAWMAAEGSAPLRGTWITTGDLQQSRLLNVCQGRRWDDGKLAYTDPQPAGLEPVTADAASWAGDLGRSAYRNYELDGEHPGLADKPDTIHDEDAVLALWARSECAAGTTYHRVSVHPNLDDLGDGQGGIRLTRAQRKELSAGVRTLLNRYLNAPGGWPRTQHCHDTKVLGEVEQWT